MKASCYCSNTFAVPYEAALSLFVYLSRYCGKTLGVFTAKGPLVAGTIISGTIGTKIGMTAAYEQAGKIRKGATLGISMQTISAYAGVYAGAKWVTAPKTGVKYRQTIKQLKFKYSKITGRPLYKPDELVSPYQWKTAQIGWKKIPRSIIDWKFFARGPKPSKFLLTAKGEKIPLETYMPVRPTPEGKIIDVGLIRYGKPKPDIIPSKWFVTPRGSYWIKITQPPKILFKFPKPITPQGIPVGKDLIAITTGALKGITTGGSFAPTTTGLPVAGFRMPGGWAIATGGVSLGFLEWLEEGTTVVHPRWDKKRIQDQLRLYHISPR